MMVAFSVFRARSAALDVMNHPIRNIVYYSVGPAPYEATTLVSYSDIFTQHDTDWACSLWLPLVR